MTIERSIKSLGAAVARLEAGAGIGRKNCAWCRYRLCRPWPDHMAPEAGCEDMILLRCEYCGSQYSRILATLPEDYRKVLRLHYSSTLEDRYTNPKAHAASIWFLFNPWRKNSRFVKRGGGGAAGRAEENRTAREPEVRAFLKIREEYDELIERRQAMLKAKYGERPFPEHDELIRTIQTRPRRTHPGLYVPKLYDLEEEETNILIRAEMEKIIFGEALPTTASALDTLQRQIDEAIEAAERNQARRREEARQSQEWSDSPAPGPAAAASPHTVRQPEPTTEKCHPERSEVSNSAERADEADQFAKFEAELPEGAVQSMLQPSIVNLHLRQRA